MASNQAIFAGVRTLRLTKVIQFVATCIVFLSGVVLFFAIGRGLYGFVDDIFPTETGSTADIAKVWSIFLIMPAAGFVTHVYWERLGFYGNGDKH